MQELYLLTDFPRHAKSWTLVEVEVRVCLLVNQMVFSGGRIGLNGGRYRGCGQRAGVLIAFYLLSAKQHILFLIKIYIKNTDTII